MSTPVAGVLSGLVIGALGTGAGLLVLLGPSEDGTTSGVNPAVRAEPDGPAVPAQLRERVAELQAEEAARDVEALEALLGQAETALALLAPVIEITGTYRPGAPAPGPAEVASWRDAVAKARTSFGDAPSAGTEVNVARAGLVSTLTDLETMVDAFDLADEVEDPDRALALADSARRAAALSWSVGATQLDSVAVEAGRGHVHLFLPTVEGSGALTADPHEEHREGAGASGPPAPPGAGD